MSKPYSFVERGLAFDSRLFQIARQLVRLVEEKPKPNSDRLKEYRDSALESLQFGLFSAAPIYPEFEKAKLANSLGFWKNLMGENDPIVRRVFHGRSPKEVADALVSGSKLADVSLRKQIVEEGKAALDKNDDPMIKLAIAIDADARAARKQYEDQVEEVQASQYGLIAKAMFAAQGTSVYPDATFTLRLAFGRSKAMRSTARKSPLSPRSAARSITPKPTATKTLMNSPRLGTRPKSRESWSSTPRSISCQPPTSSAATPAVPSSTATTKSSA